MKKLLGIVVLGLLLISKNAYASKKATVSFVCTSKKNLEVSHALIIDLKKILCSFIIGHMIFIILAKHL